MADDYFYRGRADRLRGLSASPPPDLKSHGTYMNGFYSVDNPPERFDSFGDKEAININFRKRVLVNSLSQGLVKLIITSLKDSPDTQTDLDYKILTGLKRLKIYDPDLSDGLREVYNAVQKSKRFTLKRGERTKVISSKELD